VAALLPGLVRGQVQVRGQVLALVPVSPPVLALALVQRRQPAPAGA